MELPPRGLDAWVLAQRPRREALDPWKPQAFFVEQEPGEANAPVDVATIFLVNRECPWRCLMCDLWRNTLTETAPPGAIPAQIDYALEKLPPARWIKLYNAGSFFDPHAIPPSEYAAIAARVKPFERVIVESHPALAGERCLVFRDLLSGRLEVAMGLETAHPDVLARLNKRMTLHQFSAAARFLKENNIDLRVFILVQPPFLPAAEALEWAARSLDFGFDCGATAATLIPTRGGNGAMEALAESGQFRAPRMATLEAAMQYGLEIRRGRVFVDLWDMRLSDVCSSCHAARVERLGRMNLLQTVLEPFPCDVCKV